MGWSDFEITHFFIVENSKQCMNFNTGCVTNVANVLLFIKFLVIVVSSNDLWKIGLKLLQLKFVKKS